VAQFLREQGYRAYALRDGLQGWYDAGFPLEPRSAERGRTAADLCPDCGRPLAAHGVHRGPSPGAGQ
jgi:hypothetical protein